MTSKETAGRDGKGEEGRARTREVKLAVFITQDKLDKDRCPVRDRDSASVIAAFEPAGVFAGLVKAEGIRRGADAQGPSPRSAAGHLRHLIAGGCRSRPAPFVQEGERPMTARPRATHPAARHSPPRAKGG
jgi:hypothetical protein